ncbi:hypothetical protein MVEN_01627600 [Mycena venus]|uniref:Uncharacterized protein n=1 Tax=Mycena venus TaxID=2733690 RepID=A0A8H6XQL3_9AGAR|nr:hypothetical protein MVEN_01627600 [Mycena venus]
MVPKRVGFVLFPVHWQYTILSDPSLPPYSMIAPRDDSNTFPITEAQLTGNYFETLTYGIYLATCYLAAQPLFWIPQPGEEERLRRRSEIRWMLVSVFCLLFVVNTFDDIIGLVHIIVAFVKYTGPGGAKGEFTSIHEWINVVRNFTQTVNMIVGDFVLIYRCYIVYGRRWRPIALSFMLYLAGIAMTVKLMLVQITTRNDAITLTSNVIMPWWSAFFAITAAQNILTTSLLVWRIWRIEHQNEKYRAGTFSFAPIHRPPLRKVIRVIAESGLAYSTMVLLTFVVSVCNSNALYPMADATLQVVGITFNVIIIRSTPRRDGEFADFDQTQRRIAGQAEGPGGGRALSGLRFLSHVTADHRKTIENVNINVTTKSTMGRLDDGDPQVDAHSLKDVAAK